MELRKIVYIFFSSLVKACSDLRAVISAYDSMAFMFRYIKLLQIYGMCTLKSTWVYMIKC